ncbi:hypothetical protein ABC347_07645 [Sphingomonas sp. 1P06PA]|uniref:hypothetical protein n=1 Tax=Sphingomonas sp. 1P06PA TaxID=554121 RepID=UPI0039A67D0F
MTPPDDIAAIAKGLNSYFGLRIVESPLLTIGPFEDWSDVRSPSRAARRRKKHRQRIRFYSKPDPKFYRIGDTITAHPASVAALRAYLEQHPHD